MRNVCKSLTVLLFLLWAGACIMPLRAQESPLKLRTLVIDAGHGGKDPGCVSADKKTYEKTLTLDIAKRFADKVRASCPDVKVILTRDKDVYLPLGDRADRANRAGADLFVSIHINAVAKGTSVSGYSIHCLGQSSRKGNDLFDKNLELVRRENAVILLEEDHEARYEGFDPNDPESYIFFSLIQNANLAQSLLFAEAVNDALDGGPITRSRGVSQDPFLVLWRTTMPAVLIECGFMSNPGDLAVLRTAEGRDGIAEGLRNAFVAFKTRYDGASAEATATESTGVAEATEAESAVDTTAQAQAEAATETLAESASVLYGTQVLAIRKDMAEDDPFFAGYKPLQVKGEKLSRYIIGTAADKSEARRLHGEIRKKFPDAFLVRIEGNSVLREN